MEPLVRQSQLGSKAVISCVALAVGHPLEPQRRACGLLVSHVGLKWFSPNHGDAKASRRLEERQQLVICLRAVRKIDGYSLHRLNIEDESSILRKNARVNGYRIQQLFLGGTITALPNLREKQLWVCGGP